MKKITMKDIANKANVSIATVSYVLNRVNNQTIPDATRQHILQIAEELNYIPNLAARSLANRRTGLVGILLNQSQNTPYWKRQSYLAFVDNLERLLTNAGYHTLVFSLDAINPSLDIIVERKLEAAFLIDVKDETFYSISSNFGEGVPLILIDSLINDDLFKQVIYDYSDAVEHALHVMGYHPLESLNDEVCIIMESFNNRLLVDYHVQRLLHLGFERHNLFIINDIDELNTISKLTAYKKAIVINEFIGNHVEKLDIFSSIAVICTCNMPEILHNDTISITFQEGTSNSAFRLMENLLKSIDYSEFMNSIYTIEAMR